MGRRIQMQTLPVLRARSATPSAPGLWVKAEDTPRGRKGRDASLALESQEPRKWHLSELEERMKLLERKVDCDVNLAKVYPRPASESPASKSESVEKVEKKTLHASCPSDRIKYSRMRTSDGSMLDLFHPTLGPYYGRQWTLPSYLNPIAGRDRSLSPAVQVSSSWENNHSYSSEPSTYTSRMVITPEVTETREERRTVLPSRVTYQYYPSLETQQAVKLANQSIRLMLDYEHKPLPISPAEELPSPPEEHKEVAAPPKYTISVVPQPPLLHRTYRLDCSCWSDPR